MSARTASKTTVIQNAATHGGAATNGVALLEEEPPASGDGASARLHEVLQERFGLLGFRGCQEEACQALVDGEDLLVVMPTGAGKSLCYQLPALLRPGTALVVSPLIALMEDQVAKLCALGLRAARIHSGRSRAESRQTCIDYLEGRLDYLFIAPERLAVPRFGEFLARRTPSLIAVDEAHCISQWGHDFRPDYRNLKRHLARFEGSPIIAMTATATQKVQDDIARELALKARRRLIHGFRRDNLAVEVCEVAPSQRIARMQALLGDPERRPAIVYVPTRKAAEETAAALDGDYRAAAYHAGMSTQDRDRVQQDFAAGEVAVVVATCAFGMGIDKADVRTVVHGALPPSVEAYYQEIGRGGRDGKLSRAILMHSFVDRRIQETLFERNYPPVATLRRVLAELPDSFVPAEETSRRGSDSETRARAIEQLTIHGALERDPWTGEVRRGQNARWEESYARQRSLRELEIDDVAAFASSGACRMCTLVAHFGDKADSYRPCGICDVCDPDGCAVRRFREASSEEQALMAAILEVLREQDDVSKGRVFRALEEERRVRDRKSFEAAVEGLWRAGYVACLNDTFQKDGRDIPYQRLCLTAEGREVGAGELADLRMDGERAASAAPRGRASRSTARGGRGAAVVSDDAESEPLDPDLVERLRSWRRQEATARGVPAYRILTNRALEGIARARPQNEDDLLSVHGVGKKFLEELGPSVLELLSPQA